MKSTSADTLSSIVESKPVRFLSTGLTIVAALFIGYKMTYAINWNQLGPFNWIKAGRFLGYSVLYGSFGIPLMMAWSMFIKELSDQAFSFKQVASIYGRTQLAKYIPGNVFHFVTRHLDTSKLGIRHTDLFNGAFFEMTGLLLSSSLLSVAGLFFVDYPIQWLNYALIAIIGLLLLLIIGYTVKHRYAGETKPGRQPTDRLRELAKILPLYILFFVATGFLFVLIYHFEMHWVSVDVFGALFFAVIISWIAGFVIPGAPGGLGIREAALLLMLSPVIGETNALFMALGYRIVTLIGDLILFLFSSAFEFKLRSL